ncbi:hypothetical protein M408DRAFT_63988 [Serendipita vermifera MAFF 305830]|uniref:Hydrophobin n=1 Tax=Serendipita vermifera MAFF 305830 TaxID=933852 RepID=A0A0C3B4J0_SERVB|nr:hypothetical protein M408DRAFT_63988 [Serendipita vermifera MAFF 305830]
MFSRTISFFAIVTIALVGAGPVNIAPRTNHINSPEAATYGSCNVGEAQCCQSIHQSNDQSFKSLSSLLGLNLPIDGLMAGVQCSPILNLAGLASGSSSCNSQPVCCTGNEYHGLINIGCSPIHL